VAGGTIASIRRRLHSFADQGPPRFPYRRSPTDLSLVPPGLQTPVGLCARRPPGTIPQANVQTRACTGIELDEQTRFQPTILSRLVLQMGHSLVRRVESGHAPGALSLYSPSSPLPISQGTFPKRHAAPIPTRLAFRLDRASSVRRKTPTRPTRPYSQSSARNRKNVNMTISSSRTSGNQVCSHSSALARGLGHISI
jgi:hypothetical protein